MFYCIRPWHFNSHFFLHCLSTFNFFYVSSPHHDTRMHGATKKSILNQKYIFIFKTKSWLLALVRSELKRLQASSGQGYLGSSRGSGTALFVSPISYLKWEVAFSWFIYWNEATNCFSPFFPFRNQKFHVNRIRVVDWLLQIEKQTNEKSKVPLETSVNTSTVKLFGNISIS